MLIFDYNSFFSEPITIGLLESATIPFQTKACQDSKTDAVFFVESIDLAPRVVYPYRGAISMKLTSPEGMYK